MTARHRIVVTPQPLAGPGARSVELGHRTWDLMPVRDAWRETLTWQRASLFQRTWSLEATHGTVLVLHEVNLLARIWRAESALGGWTLKRSWNRTTTLRDDQDAVVLQFHSGWLGRGRIEPASGPDLIWRRDWFRAHVVESQDAHRLIELVRGPGFLRRGTLVTLADAVRGRDDVMPLLALAWLLTLSGRYRHHG